MTAAERYERAAELMDQALGELEAAMDDTPPVAVRPALFLRTSLRVEIRRVRNLRKMLTTSTTPPAA